MTDDITGDLDLLGDWLDAKGYTEEAGLCTRAMDEINKLRDGVRSTIQERDVLSGENFDLRAENEKLRAERDKFYIEYRMVCDEECKIVHAENEKLRAALSELVGAASRVNMRTGTEFYTAWRAAYDITKEATIEDYSTVRTAAAALKETEDE